MDIKLKQDIFELHIPLKHKAKDVRYNNIFITVEDVLDFLLSKLGYVESFSSTDTLDVTHNLDTTDVMVQVYNSSNEMILPESITLLDSNTVRITFAYSLSGKVVLLRMV